MVKRFERSLKIKDIAATMINERVELQDIKDKEPVIEYLVFMSDSSSFLGKCTHLSDKMKYLTGNEYIIELWFPVLEMNDDKFRDAIIFHELNHIKWIEGKELESGKWGMKKHDIEDFSSVVKYYGMWNPAVVSLFDNFNKNITIENLIKQQKDAKNVSKKVRSEDESKSD